MRSKKTTAPFFDRVSPRKSEHASKRWQEHLLRQRMDLSVLIYTMEHDRSLNALSWQITSMKRQLQEIEQRIQVTKFIKHGKMYGRN